MRLTILGALPRELSHIINNLGAAKSPEAWDFPVYLSTMDSSEITIVQTGMGIVRSKAALKVVLERSKPDCIVSVGFAGALYHGSSPGDLVLVSRFFLLPAGGEESANFTFMQSEVKLNRPLPDPLVERLSGMSRIRQGSIITLKQPMKKTVLAEQIPKGLHFPVCDMETFGLAELSRERDVPFLAVRSVSDILDEEVPPELIGVVDEMGEPKLGRLFHAVTTNPALVTDVLRLRRNSETAARNLGLFIKELCRALPVQ